MKITEELYLIGSGKNGFYLTEFYDCNVYLINGGGSLALVDTGAGKGIPDILENIKREGFNPENVEYVFLTHEHADHTGGLDNLSKYIQFQAIISEKVTSYLASGDEKRLGLEFAKRNGFLPSDYTLIPYVPQIKIRGGEKFHIGHLAVKTIALPGHSPGSICYFMEGNKQKYLFTGDTLFLHGYIGYIKGSGSSLEDYKKNIRKLKNLDIDLLLPGHDMFCFKDGQEHIDLAVQSLEVTGQTKSIIDKFPKQIKLRK